MGVCKVIMTQEPIGILNRANSFLGLSKAFVKWFLKLVRIRRMSGPEMVEKNLLRGLALIGQLYEVNPFNRGRTKRIYILRDVESFVGIADWEYKTKKIFAGPNLSAQEHVRIQDRYSLIQKHIVPSKGVFDTLVLHGIPPEKIVVWPVGIDTHNFVDCGDISKKYDALIYFKRRSEAELESVIALLSQKNQTYTLLQYGHYSISEFKKRIARCRYAVILDNTESQGIAIEEIMACNVPMFVFDQIYLGDSPRPEFSDILDVSSVPYWSDECGVRVSTDMYGKSKKPYMRIEQCGSLFEDFLKSIHTYTPRNFIVKNLSLERQARAFLDLV